MKEIHSGPTAEKGGEKIGKEARKKLLNRKDGPIGPMKESKNVFKLSKDAKINKDVIEEVAEVNEDATEKEETNRKSENKSERVKGIENTKRKARESKEKKSTISIGTEKPTTPEFEKTMSFS